MDLREMGCEDGRWMELAQDRVRWRALVLALLNLSLPRLAVQVASSWRLSASEPRHPTSPRQPCFYETSTNRRSESRYLSLGSLIKYTMDHWGASCTGVSRDLEWQQRLIHFGMALPAKRSYVATRAGQVANIIAQWAYKDRAVSVPN
jgi:hypothetical protein